MFLTLISQSETVRSPDFLLDDVYVSLTAMFKMGIIQSPCAGDELRIFTSQHNFTGRAACCQGNAKAVPAPPKHPGNPEKN
jgi:hypothetical protein